MMEGKVPMISPVQDHIVTQEASGNGNAAAPLARGGMTREDIEALAEQTAQELLGVSADEAFAMLDRGELDGTLAGGSLSSLRWLLRK
jgi:hypothetical protein